MRTTPPAHVVVELCMGSACHQQGTPAILAALQRLLAHRVEQQLVELRGSFCLGPCIEHVAVRLRTSDGAREALVTRISPENVEAKVRGELEPAIAGLLGRSGGGGA